MNVAPLGPLDLNVDRPASWAEDKADVLRYLRSAEAIDAARGLLPDELDPAHPLRVPMILRTDGAWVWSAEIEYYADRHDIPVIAALVEHARDHDFVVTEVTDEMVDAAFDALDAVNREVSADDSDDDG